nr:DUF4435 domain-containing protein [Prevotella sp.]
MSSRLTDNINSKYIESANMLTSKHSRRKIVAYVESYDDIYFWRTVLGDYENETRYFEIMLPSREENLLRGKKSAISSIMDSTGKDMIACVDADYDYLMQGQTKTSQAMLDNKYVFHTYVYAIENYQCYAPGLHEVCVMVTLNDHRIFDFEDFFIRLSRIIYPLFLWNIWFCSKPFYTDFTITEFNSIVKPPKCNPNNPDKMLEALESKIQHKINFLRKRYHSFANESDELRQSLEKLGVNQDNTYLYIQGHHLFDTIVVPILSKVCDKLVYERQREIEMTSKNFSQQKSELSCYAHSVQDVGPMLKKCTFYKNSEPFKRLENDIKQYLKI